MNARRHPARRGLILREAVTLTLVLGTIAAMLLLAATRARRDASIADDLANLRALSTAHAAYAADNEDRFGTFVGPTPNHAAAEAWSLLRERTGRSDWFRDTTIPSAWLPHVNYSALVLAEYLDQSLPAPAHISPQDHIRQLWQSDPYEGFEALPSDLRPIGVGSRRWPFSSSYQLPPAFWSPDAMPTVEQTQGSTHRQFDTAGVTLGGRRFEHVLFPAQKVLLHDENERYFGPRRIYFAHPTARVPMAFVDGAADLRLTGAANLGWLPSQPPTPTRFEYAPFAWEAPTSTGGFEALFAFYRFTRRGLLGRDYGGPQVPLP